MSVLIVREKKSREIDQLRYYLLKLEIPAIYEVSKIEEVYENKILKKEKEINAIIHDVRLTSETIVSVYKKLNRLREITDIPIVLSVNKGEINQFENIFEMGIFDFIEKPYQYIHVKGRILSAIKYRTEATLRQLQDDYLKMDLDFAITVQKSVLPSPLQMNGVQYDGLYIPSNTLGGDMYCWYKINDHLSAVLLYDVMGHGLASSLVTMSIHSLIKGMITRLIDPVLVMTELNRHVYELFNDESKMDGFLLTAIYVLIDSKEGTIHYVNASHPTGYLIGEYEETVKLSSNTPILGLFPTIKVVKNTIKVEKRSRIVLYTDGISTLGDSITIDSSIFYPYLKDGNTKFLKRLSEDYKLFSKQYRDDITVVSITLNL